MKLPAPIVMSGASQMCQNTAGRATVAVADAHSVERAIDGIDYNSGAGRVAEDCSQQFDGAAEIRDVIGLERQRVDTRRAKSRRCRAIVLACVKDHEVGVSSEHRLDIRLESDAELRDEPGGIRPEIELRAPNHARACTQRKENLGRRGVQRHDARWRLADPHRISEVVADSRDLGAWLLARGKRERAGDKETGVIGG